MTDMVIPPEAIHAAGSAVLAVLGGSFDVRNGTARWQYGTAALEAALPHLRPMLELAGNLGRELGRREAAEETAAALEAEALSDHDAADDLRWAAAKAREIATKEPK